MVVMTSGSGLHPIFSSFAESVLGKDGNASVNFCYVAITSQQKHSLLREKRP